MFTLCSILSTDREVDKWLTMQICLVVVASVV